MTTLREAAQQALEALKCLVETHEMGNTIRADIVDAEEAIASLKAALEQPEQEPVAWLYRHKTEPWKQATVVQRMDHLRGSDQWHEVPLYTHPPRREWRGLTEDELGELMRDSCGYPMCPNGDDLEFARAIEAKLKEKNHE